MLCLSEHDILQAVNFSDIMSAVEQAMVIYEEKSGEKVEIVNFSVLGKPVIKPSDSFVKECIVKKNNYDVRGSCPNVTIDAEIECELVFQRFGEYKIYVEKLK